MITFFHAIYSLSIRLYVLGISMASFFLDKAALWKNGRKGIFDHLLKWRRANPGEVIWIHCASLGEFEQGRPVIEALKKNYPDKKILLTFFSPSGYEIRKNYAIADHVCYLPADTPSQAKRFVEIVSPTLVLVVKYEYWANYFFEVKRREIPLMIISGILRPEQRFFGFFKKFWQKVLQCVTHFYVQDDRTLALLREAGFANAELAGDTRFDRVFDIAQHATEVKELEVFRQGTFCLVAGSTWEPEEKLLANWWKQRKSQNGVKLIIVPHEIDAGHISGLKQKFPQAILWTDRTGKDLRQEEILIMDTIGMLSSVYRYCDAALIGGGFGKGIHNTLEAATWGVPVAFGPNYQKFREAIDLIEVGGGFSFKTDQEWSDWMDKWLSDSEACKRAGEKSADFVRAKVGATSMIMRGIAPILQKKM